MSSSDRMFGEFCPNCDAILPVPENDSFIVCRVCKHSTDATVLDGLDSYTEKIINTYDRKDVFKTSKSGESNGPLVDRKCSKCAHEGMYYATLQLRSADEGQTVFFTCQRCGFKEIENS